MANIKELKNSLIKRINDEPFDKSFNLDKLLLDLELRIVNHFLTSTKNLTECAGAINIGRTTFWMRYVEPNAKKRLEK